MVTAPISALLVLLCSGTFPACAAIGAVPAPVAAVAVAHLAGRLTSAWADSVAVAPRINAAAIAHSWVDCRRDDRPSSSAVDDVVGLD
jgi:hypothetical protein